ncbi:unnamed protein product [Orchesella dallaii]|uniref:Uncharacterized protein n=1 Tax=Orchesella dallaii TaxID=48710 RepID=A0ABP1S8T7_9HEXA
MGKFSIIRFAILIANFGLYTTLALNTAEKKPTLILDNIDTTIWRNLSRGSNHIVLFHPTGSDVFVSCEAPYPIQWNISGILAPADVVKIQPARRNFHDEKRMFKIIVNIFFADAIKFAGLAASAQIACEMVNDHKVRDHFSVFVRGNNPFVEPVTTVVTNSKLIPCPTTDPTTPTMLYLRSSDGVERLVQDVTYSPTEGFHSNQVFNGFYLCRKQSSSFVPFTARVTPVPAYPSDRQFSPPDNFSRAFTDESIEFTCSSKTVSILLVLDKNVNVNANGVMLTYSVNTERMKVAKLSVPRGTNQTNFTGKVACVTTARTQLIKEWTYEFIEAPDLYLDNFEGEVDCLSTLSPKMVQTVRCRNRMDCNFMDHCFRNETLCNFKKQKQFFATTDTFCWVEKLQSGASCTSVPYSHLNGIAQCTVLGMTKKYEFFTSLDFLRYSNWKDAPERELLRMDEMPEILYTNGSTQFFCVGSAFLFADSLNFEIEYKNRTINRYILKGDDVSINVSNPYSENPRKIDEFNVIGVLDINLPIDAVGIHCVAPWWNSTEVMKTSRQFETRELLAPIMMMLVRGGNTIQKENFYVDRTNSRLECFAKGEPQPEYQWLYRTNEKSNFRNVSEMFPTLTTSVASSGAGYLEFPTVNEKNSGEFKCIATNRVGSVSRSYQLEVTKEPLSGRTAAYIGTVAAILLVLAIVLGALIVFIRRYNKAKELVRNLTDNEIEEFFQGRPELLGNAEQNFEAINFMPYKTEFEIPIDDIAFDSTEANLLGSGEFAYVVRGMIISKAKSAAIKVSKPSADVNLFKSLLSEVKIMLYIGHHENVITLVGVCTQDIRNRALYIVTEICELGSLDSYLRKRRKPFVNLINVNQEIDKSLLPEDREVKLSTLDLISISAQIACGMEYLASKSVIHADLAGRNVLLTSEKICKISDFGLSKKLYECNNYTKKSKSPLPWRWMAIESLNTLTFSTQSDVWSYGVTLFEIFTLGDIPFPNEDWDKQFLMRLASGMRMGRPKYSTQEIYSKIVACWENEPDLRPCFSTLRFFFQKMLKDLQYDPSLVNKDEITKPLYSNIDDSTDNWAQNNGSGKPLYVNSDTVIEESIKEEKPLYQNQNVKE